MRFKELLLQAQAGDETAMVSIFEMYKPLLIKNAIVNGIFGEDLYQELNVVLLKAVFMFRV